MAVVNLKIEKGVDNKHDPHKLGQLTDFRDQSVKVLTQAQNVDLDDNGVASRRIGRTSRLAATAPHSLWVHPFTDTVAYYVAGGVLYKLNTDWTSTAVQTLSNNNPGSFEIINGSICFSNGVDLGWVLGATYTAFSYTAETMKTAMPAGQYVAYDAPDGSLVVASGSVLYKSEPYIAERRDARISEFPLSGYIRMLGWVEDGWWVATDSRVSFIKRDGEDGFTFVDISDNPPADGCFIQGWEDVENGKRRFVAWASVDGFCEGRAGGGFKNLSPDTALPTGSTGNLFSRTINGINQYIAVINDPEGAETYTADSLVTNTYSV